MWVNINDRWHFVVWTDPDYISMHGEMLHKTRCGLLKIRLSYAAYSSNDVTCARCLKLLQKDGRA